MKIQVAKWGTPKKIFKKKQNTQTKQQKFGKKRKKFYTSATGGNPIK